MHKRSASLGAVAAITLGLSGSAPAQGCQNQLAIDACLAGCSATEGLCGTACGVLKAACREVCDSAFGLCDTACDACDAACDVCCATTCFPGTCGGCRSGCTDCRDDCDGARRACRSACQLDCDDCILECEAGCPTCEPFRKVGESCVPAIDRCADGLVCWPASFPGQSGFQCFPGEAFDLSDDDVCRAMHSPGLHDDAIDGNIVLSYGAGAAASGVVAGGVEVGTVYDPGGCFGCYATTCVGAETNVEVNAYAALGQYESFDDFPGESLVEVGSAGVGVVSLVGGLVLNPSSGAQVGAIEALAFGPSLVPVTLGLYSCNTVVDTAGCLDANGNLVEVANNPPMARCSDMSVCTVGADNLADVDIDNGSVDPDGDTLTLVQSPAGLYAPGNWMVTLTVTDPDGLFDSCDALVTVNGPCAPALCGAGVGFTAEAPVLSITLLMVGGMRWTRSRREPATRPLPAIGPNNEIRM